MQEEIKKEVTESEKVPKEKFTINKRLEEKIDAELADSFPASDPPSYSQPGNDDIKDNT